MNEESVPLKNEAVLNPKPNPLVNSQKEKDEKKHNSGVHIAKQTFALIVTLLLITIGLSWAAFAPKKQPPVQTAIPIATTTPIQTVLTISSSPILLATPSSYKTDVIINTGQDKVTAVQLELTYDPEVLTNVDIVHGGFFTNPEISLKEIDQSLGRISFALKAPGPTNADNGIVGQGIIATIKFSLKPGQKTVSTSIDFLPKTKVSAEGTTESVLRSTVGTNFTLNSVLPITPTPSTKPARK